MSNLEKGRQKTGGRKKGTPNKIQGETREMIAGALNAVGGQKYLEQQAIDNPVAFMNLVGKTLPKDIKAEISGEVNHAVSVIKLLPLANE